MSVFGNSPKLLFFAPSGFPLGGVADWLDYLLPGLRDAGAHCVLGLVAGRFHDTEAYLHRHPWSDVVVIHSPTGSQEGRIVALMRTIKDVAPDLVLVVNIVDVYEAVRRIRILGLACPRVATTLHALQCDLLLDIAAERDVIDAVVVTNRLAERLAGDSIQSFGRVLYAPYGVHSVVEDRMPRGFGGGEFRLLYVGRLEESQKRVSDLPKLLHRARADGNDVHLSIAGGGPAETSLREQARQSGLQECVHFLGVLSPAQLADAYRQQDALVVTSTWETGPIVILEAMIHALPVISSRYTGSGLEGALVDGQNCLLFDIGDVHAAAEAIQHLREQDVRVRLIKGGQDLVRTRYSRMQSLSAWVDAIRQVLDFPLLPAPVSRPMRRHGRLDRFFGSRMAERIRSALGLRYLHSEAGGTWPHTLHRTDDDAEWLADIAKMDRNSHGGAT